MQSTLYWPYLNERQQSDSVVRLDLLFPSVPVVPFPFASALPLELHFEWSLASAESGTSASAHVRVELSLIVCRLCILYVDLGEE